MKMTFQPKKRSRAKVHGFRVVQVEEKFWLLEEQREERNYQHRPHICGLFFYLSMIIKYIFSRNKSEITDY